VVNADRIIVMEKGSIVQEGTFESLMREDGLFRRLAQSQLQAEDAAGGGEG
jgi:ATP-binding cassette subfamily B protein